MGESKTAEGGADAARGTVATVEAARARYREQRTPDGHVLGEAVPIVTDWLAMHVGMVERGTRPPLAGSAMQRYVLDGGLAYRNTGLPRGYTYDEPRLCFKNAAELAMADRSLTYVEGFAYTGLIVAHHAWCVDEDGRVIDTTWKQEGREAPPEEWEYLGVPFDTQFLCETLVDKETYGLLDYPGLYEDES